MCGAVLFFFFFREKDLSSFPDPDESPEPLPSIHNPLPQREEPPLAPHLSPSASPAVLVKKKSRAECDREKRDVYEVYGLEGLRAGLEVGHPLHRAEDNQA